MWFFLGMMSLLISNVPFPKNIKQYIFHSMITGPIGAVVIVIHYCLFMTVPRFLVWIQERNKTLE